MYVPNYNGRGLMCSMCSADISTTQAKEDHNRFHVNMVSREEAIAMSSVNWCDPGDHPFKAGSKGSQSMNGTEVDEDTGESRTVRMDICPKHTQKAMIRAAIEATKSGSAYTPPAE